MFILIANDQSSPLHGQRFHNEIAAHNAVEEQTPYEGMPDDLELTLHDEETSIVVAYPVVYFEG